MIENMRTASAEHFDTLWSWNTLERRPWHCTLDFHIKVQVWGKSLSVSQQSSKHPKEYPCFKKVSDLACSKKKKERKKRERDKKKKKEKNKEREKKRERKKERVREPWLHINQEAAPLPFQAFAAPLRSIRPLQGVLFPHMRQEYHMPSLQQFQGIHPSCWR